jgi:G:T-mismatch repair DNA endonuclease (very short patch repair protein)
MESANRLPPHILAEWHPERNSAINVMDVTAGSHLKVWWLGQECGHEWEANVQSRALKNQGCSVCAGKTVLQGFNDLATKFPALASEWHPTKNDDLYPTQVTSGSSKKVWWLGSDCRHEWEAIIGNRASKGHRCPFCFGKKLLSGVNDLATLYPDIAADWHPTKNGDLLPTQVRPNAAKKIWWLDKNCRHEWDALLGNRVTSKQGCPICVGQKVLVGSNDLVTTHPKVASEWHPTLNTIPASSVTHGSGEKVWWLGKDCKHEWEMSVSSRTGSKPQGCPYCAGNKILMGFNDLSTRFPEIAAEWHPTRNGEFLPTQVGGSTNRLAWWLSRNCGHEWEMLISGRTGKTSQGCPFCAGKRVLVGFNDLTTMYPLIAAEWHPTKNGDLLPIDVSFGSSRNVWWLSKTCEHEWEMSVSDRTKPKSHGCPYCGSGTLLSGFNDLMTVYPLIAAEWHPTLNKTLLPTEVFNTSGKKAWWLGPTCNHEWEATIANRINGSGCPVCIGYKVLIGFNDLASQNPTVAAQWHPTKNAPLLPEQFTIGSDKKVWWICAKTHEWMATIYSRGTGNSGCPQCYAKTFVSQAEHSIAEFIRNLGLSVVQSDRRTLKGKELDILVPEKNVAIEYNGVFWHTEKGGKDKDYHRDKWLAAKNAGIQLVQIWEDEWNKNPEQIKRMVAHKLGMTTESKVFARKTIISEVTKQVAENFLDEHHVQGWAAGSYYYGLFKKNDPQSLVALLVLRTEKGNGLNIIRYATSANVVGGFTKLLAYAERTLLPDFIITFSDHCVSDGGLYANNGFIADKELKPDYRYVINAERKHKFGYRIKRFKDDPSLVWIDGLTERELADLNGLDRIWDAGKTRWLKKFV